MTAANRAAALAEELARARLMKYREEADYNPSYVFTVEDVRTLREETARLAARIAELIRTTSSPS